MNKDNIVALICLIGFILLPWGVSVLIYGPLNWTPTQYFAAYAVLAGSLIILNLLILLVKG